MLTRQLYYLLKPLMPRRLQLLLRRQRLRLQRLRHAHHWPIDASAGQAPAGWRGWPEARQFAVVLTHDVETAQGQAKCRQLMELEQQLGFCSSFNFVPERYAVCEALRAHLAQCGFEVGVHGLNHDGKLYGNWPRFQQRAARINQYLKDWGAVGFRSPAMHHNLAWLHALDIAYDASTFDTDPFEAQPDGMGTIFPFWVPHPEADTGYVELPYTLPQDFTLFVLMGEHDIRIWQQKVDWIAAQGGMVLINTHPDYMWFDRGEPGPETYPSQFYADLLRYIQERYAGQYWPVLPRDLTRFWVSEAGVER
ncbi:MAG: hypothetical protein ETSY1_18815 [Candidatus Entotheonella factor]|uniref:NodB homology domain-containing protein n=1 Tax=Entotheonella factor TaxID=1429438 RepID=W4LKK6_ENTF1|nr:MAG: hypothetical protein ETSY1_18815 [Candidatus Entotheonella factor]